MIVAGFLCLSAAVLMMAFLRADRVSRLVFLTPIGLGLVGTYLLSFGLAK